MRVRITENRVEFMTREYEIEVPDGTDLEDRQGMEQLIQNDDLDRDVDFETVNATQELVSVEEALV